jgi:hypothetical protein
VIVNDNQYLYSKNGVLNSLTYKRAKLKLKLQKNRLKNLLQGPNFIYFTTSGITNYKITMHIAIAGNIGSEKQL